MQHNIFLAGAIFAACILSVASEIAPDDYAPVGTRREGSYYDAYPAQAYDTPYDTPTDADKRQGFLDESAIFGALPGILALLGVIGLAIVQANDQRNQQSDIDSICTQVTALGNFDTSNAITLTTAANMPGTTNGADIAGVIIARFNIIENALRNLATPDCM